MSHGTGLTQSFFLARIDRSADDLSVSVLVWTGEKVSTEDHYMRGPGPKSRAKHDVGCAQGLRRSIESE
jgi:hypothetical protein